MGKKKRVNTYEESIYPYLFVKNLIYLRAELFPLFPWGVTFLIC